MNVMEAKTLKFKSEKFARLAQQEFFSNSEAVSNTCFSHLLVAILDFHNGAGPEPSEVDFFLWRVALKKSREVYPPWDAKSG